MYTITDFKVNDRVELHPATDLWMRGARFGTVTKVGRKWLHVKLDTTGAVTNLAPHNIMTLITPDPDRYGAVSRVGYKQP
jgi:hypothetical protein